MKKQKKKERIYNQKSGIMGDKNKEDFETPKDILDCLKKEFLNEGEEFFDPCPYNGRNLAIENDSKNGLLIDWNQKNFINPPYNETKKWIIKGVEEFKKGKTCIFLIVSRPSTNYWNDFIITYASEIRHFTKFIKFNKNAKKPLPLPICIVVFKDYKSEKENKNLFYKIKDFGNGYKYWTHSSI